MRVLLVTSPNERCGIAEYGHMLMVAVRSAHPDVEFRATGPTADAAVDFVDSLSSTSMAFDVVHVNHQAALHSSWSAGHIQEIREFCPVVVTHHDTFEAIDIIRERNYAFFNDVADHIVVHEPVSGVYGDDVTYLRQPIPAFDGTPRPTPPLTVGSVGFDFPWKNFKKLDELAARAGWRTSVFGGDAWLPRREAIARLAGCHASAFLYQTGNSGTSGAIRLGLAACKPVIAFPCRQFRDLYEHKDPGVREAVLWVDSDEAFLEVLGELTQKGPLYDNAADRCARLAERDSWSNGADVYYRIYKRVIREWRA